MAQGNHKLGKAKQSVGAQKRKAVKTVKHKAKKGNATVVTDKRVVETTKAINRKNERLVAAKASTSGTHFFLKDIAEKGEQPTCFHATLYMGKLVVGKFHSVLISKEKPFESSTIL